MRRILTIIIAALALAAPQIAWAQVSSEQAAVDRATAAIEQLRTGPGAPPNMGELLHKARGVMIFPELVKAGFFFGAQGGSGVLLSRDRGKTWYDRSSGIDYVDMHYIENYPGSKERYYASSARGFYRSDNSGEHWRRVETGMPWGYTELYSYSHEWHFLPGQTPRMVLCGGKGSPGVWHREKIHPHGCILVSDDAGESWRAATQGLDKENPWMPWVLLHHPDNADALFCGMGDGARGYGFDPRVAGKGAFYTSRDRGESWEPVLKDTPSILTAWVAAN